VITIPCLTACRNTGWIFLEAESSQENCLRALALYHPDFLSSATCSHLSEARCDDVLLGANTGTATSSGLSWTHRQLCYSNKPISKAISPAKVMRMRLGVDPWMLYKPGPIHLPLLWIYSAK